MTEGKKGVSPGLEQASGDVTSLNPDPWSNILHVYGQYYCHCDAEIRGTPEALRALAEAINVALTKGRAEMLTMASDGEGYRLQVQRTNGTGMNAGGTRHYVMRMYDRGRAEAADEWKAEYARLIDAIRKLKANRTPDEGAPPLSPETAGEGSLGMTPNLNRQGD